MSKRRTSSSSLWTGRGSGQRLEIKVRPHRSVAVQLLLVVWRWRVEIAAALVLLVAYADLADRFTPTWAVVMMLAPPAAVLAWGPSRRFVARHAWCTVTRHRLRLFFTEADITNRSGRLPWIVHVRPTPVGERAWVWMIPGLSVEHIRERAIGIASTCWAREARIAETRALVTLVRVDVVRRDPLETTRRTRPIPNRLVGLSARIGAPAPDGHTRTTLPAIPPEITARPAPPAAAAQTPAKPLAAPNGPAVIVNGEDVSDYV